MATRIGNLLLEIGSIALAIAMLRGPDLVALAPAQLAGTPLAESTRVFTTLANWIPALVLTIVIIVSSIEVAQSVYRLMKSNFSSPYPITK